jgi:hypothetical protein
MTPIQCLEARARLGWSRKDLAEACALAAPIVRLYEAGALEGFQDCEAAIAEALCVAEVARLAPLARAPKAKRATARPSGGMAWLVEGRRRCGVGEDAPQNVDALWELGRSPA